MPSSRSAKTSEQWKCKQANNGVPGHEGGWRGVGFLSSPFEHLRQYEKKYYVEIFFNYELVLIFMKHENTLLSLIRLFTKISITDHWFARYTSYNT